MQKQHQLKNGQALENFRIFPYIAWGLVVGFCFFVYTITQDLKDVTKSLETQTQWLQSQVNATSSPNTTDFDRTKKQ
ncbi:hypothetical protein KC887_06925 [Candidatus Kaiserbacteria bacterium]|nr:hypothetical protein [Candidatus Kaiserbacteria bacterium]